ncbi:hypothetical protein ACL02T_34485 [Pseudonocardia sp. RS010]|uniref:hypothetical protein n=1 Tax=Pseudonocardia sp. RS010 TaxID=3385979 RepID=UPI0039A26AC9
MEYREFPPETQRLIDEHRQLSNQIAEIREIQREIAVSIMERGRTAITVTALADELGVSRQALYLWKQRAQDDPEQPL